MNGLTLRISGSNSKKIKGSLSFSPVIISDNFLAKTDDENALYRKFHDCHTVDDQLAILKEYLNDRSELPVNFIAQIFLQAEAKNPVKCYIARYITKSVDLQEPFTKVLSEKILSHVSVDNIDGKDFMDFVPRLASCIENFPAGSLAVKEIDLKVAEYLTKCLQYCTDMIRNLISLSPTEKNEIYDLAHLSLRLLLHIMQKVKHENVFTLTTMFTLIKHNIKVLLFDEDVPMDTKSVSGILLVSMLILENGTNSWIEILKPSGESCNIIQYLENDSAKLSLYSALVTVVSAPNLFSGNVDDESALIVLTNKILDIGESTITNSTFTLSVTRTLVQISKALPKATDSAQGVKLVDCLLTFVWSHLEHHMDSVRHLTAQILANIVKYCAALMREGDDKPLDQLFEALGCLDQSRKSYYVSLTSLTSELGASCILQRKPKVIRDVIDALHIQAVQASATTALETLLQKHSKECSSEVMYDVWVKPILEHVTKNSDSAVLNILEGLLLQAVKLDSDLMNYLLPHIKQMPSAKENGRCDLKCVLMLLSVARKSNVDTGSEQTDGEWRGLVSYDVLEMAVFDAVDEVRSLSLALVVESRRTTEAFSSRELDLVRRHLAFNANTQQPDARQQTLALVKKFIKRLEDSYRVLKRQKVESDYYLTFLDGLREMCYGFLIPGVNYSRRYVSLQVLAWCEHASFEGYQRTWKPEYVLNLMMHLEDSYESNKAFALDILNLCPVELIESQKRIVGLEMGEVFKLASSVKPTDCVSAAYKIRLIASRLSKTVLEGRRIETPEAVNFALLSDLLTLVREQLSVCKRSVVLGARGASMYGALHCALHLLDTLDPSAISQDRSWSALIEEIIETCVEVNAAVACVVNNSSPEGHLPMDMSGLVVSDHGNSGNVTLEDGRPVTAQMVLLCAWRSVKEVSLVLGSISSRLSIQGEGQEHGTLSMEQMVLMGEHFTNLLAETKHRGAFEQAYVGFTKLLSRLWRCRRPELHELPRGWLRGLLATVAGDGNTSRLCPTRRSAGLPFMIQALVTTELQVSEQPKCFQECMGALLRLCGCGPRQSRAHCSNVLRALVRCAPLQQHVAPYVGDALVLALKGFDGDTWEERNASTLLLSALAARAVGGSRVGGNRVGGRGGGGKDGRITGRLFFLRYPRLYDFMLEKLNEASRCEESQMLKPSLYPILLLLGRLYPSALEGTVSNLKLCSLARPVAACASAASLHTRRLAARALAPLVSPHTYIPHIEEALTLIADKTIKRNLCHGLLLQVTTLLENKPDNLILEEDTVARIKGLIDQTMWILEQVDLSRPCYLVIDEYTKMLNLLMWSFPMLLGPSTIEKIIDNLDKFLNVSDRDGNIKCSMEISLANATNLYLIILNKFYTSFRKIQNLVYSALFHSTYEVVLAALDYLLILNDELEIENQFQGHLKVIAKEKNVIDQFRTDKDYTGRLYEVLKTAKYLECRYKCLKLLSLEDDTCEYITRANINDETKTSHAIISELTRLVESEHENSTHMYLYSLSRFLTKALKESNVAGRYILQTVRVIFACSSSDNSDSTRSVVVGFLERNFKSLIKLELGDLGEEERFEVRATLWAILVTVLEDDEHDLRARCSRVVTDMVGCSPTVGSRAAQLLRRLIAGGRDGLSLLCVLALLDFRCQVCLAEDADEECRVFDQNEKYNVFLEETVWTAACADEIKRLCRDEDLCHLVLKQLEEATLKPTFERLCGSNVAAFKSFLEGSGSSLNPKIGLFARLLRGEQRSSDFSLSLS